ncbi:E3 ubiquitin-protein ligase RHF1A [Corchorus olitorius]|uniref:E3 ubiquitin-protein ligase RHF1A n=1 Tax=Corchorus olitorius TaxID=93759 RepID=A0A1R3KPS5_9ROSI|nr:E3 ubiquitin-protein ligase RHF1A [Corchorus olitorius]
MNIIFNAFLNGRLSSHIFLPRIAIIQELLDAVRIERHRRSRNTTPAVPRDFHHFDDDFGAEEDASHSDDSDFDERILQHLAAAASRARYVHRRERQRASEVLFFTSPEHMARMQQTHPTSPEEISSYGSTQCDSPVSIIPSISTDPSSPATPTVDVVSTAAASGNKAIKPRQLQADTPHRPSSSETLSFSESIKSKWSTASARYKESIFKGTRGLKEKLLARNNSVKELSKGVQREMSAGIAGVAKMIERLDIATKRPGASVPVSGGAGERTLMLLAKY